jgi:hypothetical protein
MGRWLPMVAVSGAGTLGSVAPGRPLNPAALRPRPDWGAFPARTIRPVPLARATLPAVVAETDSKQWDRPDAYARASADASLQQSRSTATCNASR